MRAAWVGPGLSGDRPSPQRRLLMTSQGRAQASFQRAIKRGHLLNAEIAVRELGTLSLSEALSLCLLYEREGDAKFERAFRRWLGPRPRQSPLGHEEVELLRCVAGALGSRLHQAALSVMVEACRELRLPPPTLPPYLSLTILYGIASRDRRRRQRLLSFARRGRGRLRRDPPRRARLRGRTLGGGA